MTRVLYWNIENFGLNKVANLLQRRQKGSSLTQAQAAVQRLTHITQVLQAVNPDVVVVVEVESAPFNGAGTLAPGAGPAGSMYLRLWIQAALGGNWQLVPPLQTGPNEAVAVFYNDNNRYFAGPYVWPGGAAGPAVAPGAATGAYPGAQTLPNRNVPAGALQNGGVSEGRCAAQTAFTYAAAHMNAGTAINWGISRAPYMVSLYESAVPRTLTIFGIHAPAASGPAALYLQELANVAEIVDNLNAAEVRLVIGDFNLQLLDGALNRAAAYGHLVAAGYTLVLSPQNPAPAPPVAGYASYYATHIRRTTKAKCWPKAGRVAYYPGYRYVGSDHGPPSAAIDNAFVRYGANFMVPPPHNFTIMNSIVGSPMNVVAPPSRGAPPGSLALARGTGVPPPAIAPAIGPAYGPALARQFRQWTEYGYIRSTSDHFALALDV